MKFIDRIPFHEFSFEYVRSRGPGGQNVNKTNSAVILKWSPISSVVFSEFEKTLLGQKLILNKENEVVIKSDVFRNQDQNRSECLKRLDRLIAKALEKKKKRIATKPTKSSKIRNLQEKKSRSEIKKGRAKIDY